MLPGLQTLYDFCKASENCIPCITGIICNEIKQAVREFEQCSVRNMYVPQTHQTDCMSGVGMVIHWK